jgi:hypothetical protein
MIVLAAAAVALATSQPSSPTVSATAHATATIRVVTAVRLKLDGTDNPGAPPVRNAVLRSRDAAKLIEFQ